MVSIKYSDLDMGVNFVSSSALLDASAYIYRKTGKTWYESYDSIEEEELPEDVGDTDKYAEIPDRRKFDLGKPLVLSCASQELPSQYKKIGSSSHSSGAYCRFKDLLRTHGALDAWYKYEESATQEALCAWAKEEGFKVEIGLDETAA